jgi:PAS domain S-box-containing protein
MIDVQKVNAYLKSLTLLYVEDEETTRELSGMYLSHHVGVLITAENGSKGLDAYREHKPDIIMTDIQMPIMDGLAMLREIRKLDTLIPVIVTTAFEDSEYLKQTIDLGVSGYVTKPVNVHELDNVLRKCAYNLMLEAELATAREEAEKTNALLNALLDCMSDWVWEVDAEGRYTYCSPQVEAFLGYLPSEIIGKTFFELMHPEEAEHYRIEFTELCRNKSHIQNFENWNTTRDGRRILLSTNAVPILDPSGTLLGYRGVDEDITERQQIQKDLEQARDSAEAATKAKSEFLATMSHEIRTPMNGVIGMTGLLLDTDLNAEQRDYAEIVRKSGENLLTLINDILDFSKIEAGKLDLEILDFDLRPTLEDAIDLMVMRASDKGLALFCQIDPAVPSYLKGDPGRLRQIIINLVGNAIKFTPQGEVVVSTKLSSDQDGFATILFEVRDTGIGIPAKRLGALFSPFTQVDGSTARQYGGTGLGLAICKQLSELMGGEIGVSSEEGKGATFWFTARFEKQAGQAAEIEELKQVDISGTRILVVDNNSTNRLLITTLLKHWGCRFDSAVDAEEGLKLLFEAAQAGDPFELALLDQEMHGMNGLELGRRIKAEPLLTSTLMILVTSIGQRGDAAVMEQVGFSGYLAKPLRQLQLRNSIAMALGKSQQNYDPAQQTLGTDHVLSESVEHDTRILLAEDNIINQKVAQSLLGKLGYKADVVANGLEAVKSLEMIRYDLVLMDCLMPEMDGFEATAAIRSPDSKVLNRKVPIIAMTANAMQGDNDRCLAAGMNDYLSKPVKREVLAEMIRKWTETHEPAAADESKGVMDVEKPTPEFLLRALIVDDSSISRRITGRFVSKVFSCDEAENGLEAVSKYQEAVESGSHYDVVFMDVVMPEMDGKEAVHKIREFEDDQKLQRVPIIMVSASEMLDGIEELVSGLLRKAVTKQSLDTMLQEIFHGKIAAL